MTFALILLHSRPSIRKGYGKGKLSTDNRLRMSDGVPDITESDMIFVCMKKFSTDLGAFKPYPVF